MKYRRIDVYVPETHAGIVKDAMFAAGAGAVGNYDCCCFQVCGRGQFRPLVGSDPFIGAQGRVEHVTEWKLEMICPEGRIPGRDCSVERGASLRNSRVSALERGDGIGRRGGISVFSVWLFPGVSYITAIVSFKQDMGRHAEMDAFEEPCAC